MAIEYFGYGILYRKKEVFEYRVTKLSDFVEKIIPFFDKYSLIGDKVKNFEDFKKVSDLMVNKSHLTEEGLNKILSIKSNMNMNREWDSIFL